VEAGEARHAETDAARTLPSTRKLACAACGAAGHAKGIAQDQPTADFEELAMSECGCKIVREERSTAYDLLHIEYCPLHAAAEKLRDALLALPLESFGEDMSKSDAADFVDHAGEFFEAMVKARAALAAAKGEA